MTEISNPVAPPLSRVPFARQGGGVLRCFEKLSSGLRILHATLREIFDESAYRRFLQRHHAGPSRASYAAFLRDHSHSRAHRPRCC